jgi:alkylation response protein AidB-like acyl-CoA dehydrogenase
MSTGKSILNAVRQQLNLSDYRKKHWEGSFDEYLDIVRRHRKADSLFDDQGKPSAAGCYWGMLIEPRYGGQVAPFALFSQFLTRMAVSDPMTAALASAHGCIGAVDPVRSFGNAEQKERFLPRLASGQSLSGFALTEPAAGSDLTALRMTAILADDSFEVNGEKRFITNAIPGRTIGLVIMLEGKPAVLIAELPAQPTLLPGLASKLHYLKRSSASGFSLTSPNSQPTAETTFGACQSSSVGDKTAHLEFSKVGNQT